LAFYFKAGCDSELPADLFNEDHNKKFMNCVEQFDNIISNSTYSSMVEEKRQLDELETKIVALVKEAELVIEKLCL
jgi:hypothetical protein